MIVVDENLHDHRIIDAIAAWYPGRVVSIKSLRPRSIIKDDAIPALLRQVIQPTFVTINVADFWRKIQPHGNYCVVNVALPKERIRETPGLLFRLLRLPEFRSKASRMGRVIRITPVGVEYYESDLRVKSVTLPD